MLKKIIASVAECETESAFENGQDATVTRITLIEMDHPQPPTLVQLENITSNSFIKGTLKQKRTKSIEIKYHWLQERKNED